MVKKNQEHPLIGNPNGEVFASNFSPQDMSSSLLFLQFQIKNWNRKEKSRESGIEEKKKSIKYAKNVTAKNEIKI